MSPTMKEDILYSDSQPTSGMDGRSSTSSSLDLIEKKFDMQLPPLDYNLKDRKLAIAICWTIVLFDSCLFTVALFYSLWYGTSMAPWKVMTIVSCLAGTITFFQYFWRGWILYRDDERRPIGGGKWGFDIFQWIYTIGVVFVCLELVFGTLPDYPLLRVCAIPVPTVFALAAACELFSTVCYSLNLKTPIRISSVARGEHFRPGVYHIVEDIIAVEGHGGQTYRLALDKRFRVSPEFRSMLVKISLFWSVPALAISGAVFAVVFTVPATVAFGVGWCALFVWALPWALITTLWVPRMLKKERDAWRTTHARV